MFFTILSYCDTVEKKSQLKSLIDGIRSKYPDNKILVYSHYLGVEPQYYEGSDYYIFDRSNPKSLKRFGAWIYFEKQSKKFYRYGKDFGFAVLQMIKRSLLYLRAIGAEDSIFLNYDSNVEDFIKLDVTKMIGQIDQCDIGIFQNWGGNVNEASLTQFYIRINKLNDTFFSMIDIENYHSMPGELIPEGIWYRILLNSFGKNLTFSDFGIKNVISGADRSLPKKSALRRYMEVLLPSRDSETNKKCIAIWGSSLDIKTIHLILNNQYRIYYNKILPDRAGHFFCETDEDFDRFTLIGINEMTFDGEHFVGLDQDYWDDNWHISC